MTRATGIGSMPGEDADAFRHAVRVVFEALPDLPHLPELPGRGAAAGMTGRALAVVASLGADLQPAGWRLTDASGVDHRRARSLLAQDLDVLEEESEGYAGDVKIQVAGPWTLAATVEKPRGDKVLSDPGARRDLAQALAEGVRTHVRDVRRRVPGSQRLVVQVDEPALAAVLDARVPTASGFGRHRAVHPPEASEALGWVLSAIVEEGAEPWVHTCAAGTPLGLLRGAGAVGLSVDLGRMTAADHDQLGEALEAGESVVLGIVPATAAAAEDSGGASRSSGGGRGGRSGGGDSGDDAASDVALTERVVRWLDMLGLDPATTSERLLVSPTCGLADATPAYATTALRLARTTAANLSG